MAQNITLNRGFQKLKIGSKENQVDESLQALQKIQRAGKPLIIKGQFDDTDLDLMKRHLSLPGLCIQPVVGSLAEAEKLLTKLRNWA